MLRILLCFRSSNKADGRWAGQPQPASPVAGFNCLNDLYMCSSTGAHSPETCNGLQSLSVRGRTRTVLSCSEDTRSAPETLDEAMQVRLRCNKRPLASARVFFSKTILLVYKVNFSENHVSFTLLERWFSLCVC